MTGQELFDAGTPVPVLADWYEEQGDGLRASILRRIDAGEYDQRLTADLNKANGRRRERLLCLYTAKHCLVEAITDPECWSWAAGGTVANSYGYRSYRTRMLAVYLPDRGEIVWSIGVGNATKGSSPVSHTGLRTNSKPEDFRQWAEGVLSRK